MAGGSNPSTCPPAISTTGSSTTAIVRHTGGGTTAEGAAASAGSPGGNPRAVTRASNGPATIPVGTATARPYSIVRPRSAPSTSTASNGPGCGGTSACTTDRPVTAASSTCNRAAWLVPTGNAAAADATIGSSSTSPVSKNSGNPITMATPRLAHGAAPGGHSFSVALARAPAPFDTCSIAPSASPSATTSPVPPRMSPAPFWIAPTICPMGSPPSAPTANAPHNNPRNGCSRALTINNTDSPTPANAARIR